MFPLKKKVTQRQIAPASAPDITIGTVPVYDTFTGMDTWIKVEISADGKYILLDDYELTFIAAATLLEMLKDALHQTRKCRDNGAQEKS